MLPLDNLSQLAKQKENKNRKFFSQLKSKKPRDLDEVTRILHEKAFSRINCLDCANCCKTLGPRIVQKEIGRIAKFLNLKPDVFIEKYLRIDEDGDNVFKSGFCPFLAADSLCMVYKVRPKACADYPHTDRRKIHQILDLTLKNSFSCPAVFEIVEGLQEHYRK